MEIYTDKFLHIGSHEICEDYAVTGTVNKLFHTVHYAIVSDGCSSAQNTDIGSRILCKAAEKVIHQICDIGNMVVFNRMLEEMVLEKALRFIYDFDIAESCLMATLLVATVTKDYTRIYMIGDGGFVLKTPELNKIRFIQYTSNAPYYLAYKQSDILHDGYMNSFKDNQKVIHSIDGDEENTISVLPEAVVNYEFPTQPNQCLTLMTDGVCSFEKDRQLIDPMTVIGDFTRFKRFKGTFLKDRANMQMLTNKKMGITHFDDLGIASISVVSDENKN